MCGRYWLDPDENAQLAQIIAGIQHHEPIKTQGEVFPGDTVPVLCKSRAGNLRPFAMEWGYHAFDGRRIINARSETAAEKPMFQESMRMRRCLLPMSAYFEWETKDGTKTKYRIRPQAQGLCFLAGLYRFESQSPVCTVLTAAAAPEIQHIHPRMPVILQGENAGLWLSGSTVPREQAMRCLSE